MWNSLKSWKVWFNSSNLAFITALIYFKSCNTEALRNFIVPITDKGGVLLTGITITLAYFGLFLIIMQLSWSFIKKKAFVAFQLKYYDYIEFVIQFGLTFILTGYCLIYPSTTFTFQSLLVILLVIIPTEALFLWVSNTYKGLFKIINEES